MRVFLPYIFELFLFLKIKLATLYSMIVTIDNYKCFYLVTLKFKT